MIVCIAIICAFVLMIVFHKIDSVDSLLLKTMLVMFLLLVIYLLFVGSSVGPSVLARPDCIFGLFLPLFITLLYCLQLIFKVEKLTIIPALFAIVLLLIECNTTEKTFKDVAFYNLTKEQIISINNDIIEQMQEADADGKEKYDLIVPSYNVDNNWPLGTYANEYLSDSLYKHGLISRKIEIKIVPSVEKNMELNILQDNK